MTQRTATLTAMPGLLVWLLGCGQATPPSEAEPGVPQAPPPAAAEQPAPEHAAHAEEAALPPLPAVPEGARVFFVAPKEGERVIGPLENGKVAVAVQMGAEGIAIKPAGAVEAGSGHHHIMIDTAAPDAGAVVPKDEQHLHFGKGQTDATLSLTPGEHTLVLQLADGVHRAYGPALSATLKVTVAAAGSVAAQPPAAEPARTAAPTKAP